MLLQLQFLSNAIAFAQQSGAEEFHENKLLPESW
jgi:hypothetical protein